MASKPVIVYVAHDVGGQGGMELHLEEVISRLKEEYQVVVVAASLKLADPSGVRFIRIPVPARPAPMKMILFALLATFRIIGLKKDLLHTTGAIVLNRADFSTVHYCHHGYMETVGNTRLNQSFWKRMNSRLAVGFALWMEKLVYRPKRTKQLIAVSNRVRQELLDRFGYDSAHISTIPNGVDLQRFKPASPAAKSELRSGYGLEPEGIYLLFMGGDWPRKGLSYVIEAFDELAATRDDLYLLVVGKGDPQPYESKLSSTARQRVRFVGKQARPEDWMALSDMFVFPSSYETFSLVAHEAAASGLAVLATEVGGIEDLIQDGVNGMFIRPDAANICHAIEHLLRHPSMLQEMGQRARERVQPMTWDYTYDNMIETYQERQSTRGESRGDALEQLRL